MPNELFELAAKRRSIRRYTNDHISDDILNEIMRVALTAPCSFGHRPVEFVVVILEAMKKDGSIVSPIRCKWEPAEK